MRKRILFDKIKITTRELKENESVEDIADITNRNAEILLDRVNFRIKFCGQTLSGYGPAIPSTVTDCTGNTHATMGGWPSKEMNFVVPEDEKPRVNGWITGDYHGVDVPESDKLKKNYQSAVNDLLTGYINTALIHNLFTSPFRLAWCAVFDNGERGKLREITLPYPNIEAPLLPIVSMTLNDDRLYSNVEIRNIPASLEYCIQFPDDVGIESLRLNRIEVYATEQVPMRDSKSEIFGIRTTIIDGTPTRCWMYDRYSADEIGDSNKIRTNFKQISNIGQEGFNSVDTFQKLPIPSGKLTNFDKAKDYKAGFDDDTDIENPANPTEEERKVYMETEPLSLDHPEMDKHLQSVTLFGIFPRNDDRIKFIVYGSHHRENWHKIAVSSIPYIAGLRAVPFRWFKIGVEATLRPGDFLEAATFLFS